MTTKEAVINVIQRLPDDVEYPDIMTELYVREKIEAALRQADNGETVTHEEAKLRLSRWLK